MAARVERGATFVVSTPTKILDGNYYAGGGIMIGSTYDFSADRRRFLMLKVESPAETSLVVAPSSGCPS